MQPRIFKHEMCTQILQKGTQPRLCKPQQRSVYGFSYQCSTRVVRTKFLELKPPYTTRDIFPEVRVVKRSRQGSLPFLLTFIPNFCLPFIDILCLLIHGYKIILMVCSRIKHLDLKNCVFKPHQWSGCGVLLRNKICFIPFRAQSRGISIAISTVLQKI